MGGGDQLFLCRECSGARGAASSCARTSSGSSPSISPPRRRRGAGAARRRSPPGPGAWRSPPSGARPAPGSRSGSTTTPGRPWGGSSTSRTSPSSTPCPSPSSRTRVSVWPGSSSASGRGRPGLRLGARLRLAGLAGLLMMWLDVVIDPLAVRGDRWFLGRIFYYPEPGWYFGVPVANFVGWVVVGAAIAWGWTVLGPRVGGAPPAWGRRWPGHGRQAVGLYYLVLAFNLAITAAVAEARLFWAGVLLHVPLAVVVVCSLRSREQAGGADARREPARPVAEPMSVPISQMWTVASYVLTQRFRGRKQYPLVLMLEPLFRCNLACAGCGKIQYPGQILRKNLTVEQCLKAVDECGAPIVSIPGRRAPHVPGHRAARDGAGRAEEVHLPLHERHPAQGEARSRRLHAVEVPLLQHPHGRAPGGARRGRLQGRRLRPGRRGDPGGAQPRISRDDEHHPVRRAPTPSGCGSSSTR